MIAESPHGSNSLIARHRRTGACLNRNWVTVRETKCPSQVKHTDDTDKTLGTFSAPRYRKVKKEKNRTFLLLPPGYNLWHALHKVSSLQTVWCYCFQWAADVVTAKAKVLLELLMTSDPFNINNCWQDLILVTLAWCERNSYRWCNVCQVLFHWARCCAYAGYRATQRIISLDSCVGNLPTDNGSVM